MEQNGRRVHALFRLHGVGSFPFRGELRAVRRAFQAERGAGLFGRGGKRGEALRPAAQDGARGIRHGVEHAAG